MSYSRSQDGWLFRWFRSTFIVALIIVLYALHQQSQLQVNSEASEPVRLIAESIGLPDFLLTRSRR